MHFKFGVSVHTANPVDALLALVLVSVGKLYDSYVLHSAHGLDRNVVPDNRIDGKQVDVVALRGNPRR